jgi:hypothetical protein
MLCNSYTLSIFIVASFKKQQNMESIQETEENAATGSTIAAHCELYFQPEDGITITVRQRLHTEHPPFQNMAS